MFWNNCFIRTKQIIFNETRKLSQKVDGLPLIYGDWTSPFVVINKPPGLSCQASIPGEDSVEERILKYLGGKRVPFFPHRLDKDTQGLLLLTFNSKLTAYFSDLHSTPDDWIKQYKAMTDIPNLVIPSQIINNNKSYESTLFYPNNGETHNIKNKDIHETVRSRAGLAKGLNIKSPFICGQMISPQTLQQNDSNLRFVVKHGILRSLLAKLPNFLRDSETPLAEHLIENRNKIWKKIEEKNYQFEVKNYKYEKIKEMMCNVSYDNINAADYQHMVHKSILYSSVPKGTSRNEKLAITEFENQHVNFYSKCALFTVTLHTGRTHQIRVHFAENGFPIINDKHYNHNPQRRVISKIDEMIPQSLGLQSFRMKFPNPLKRYDKIDLNIPLPIEWNDLVFNFKPKD